MRSGSMVRWWAAVVIGAAGTLLLAWLGRLAGVPASVLVTVGAGAAALMWTAVLVTLPWNLYFDARQVLRDNALSRSRGIDVPATQDEEAAGIARRTLILAIGGHVGTALVTAVVALATGRVVGYYLAAFYLISTAIRPAVAFLAHLRVRIAVLHRESVYPRDDVAALKLEVSTASSAVEALTARCDQDRRRVAGDVAGLAADLALIREAQAAGRVRLERLTRQVEATLDGLGDQQEVLTGLRALVRMIRTESATP